MKKGITMSEESRVYQEGEAVPVPDKGGWIDGETGPVFPIPTPEPTPQQTPAKESEQPGVVPIRKPEPTQTPPKKAS